MCFCYIKSLFKYLQRTTQLMRSCCDQCNSKMGKIQTHLHQILLQFPIERNTILLNVSQILHSTRTRTVHSFRDPLKDDWTSTLFTFYGPHNCFFFSLNFIVIGMAWGLYVMITENVFSCCCCFCFFFFSLSLLLPLRINPRPVFSYLAQFVILNRRTYLSETVGVWGLTLLLGIVLV